MTGRMPVPPSLGTSNGQFSRWDRHPACHSSWSSCTTNHKSTHASPSCPSQHCIFAPYLSSSNDRQDACPTITGDKQRAILPVGQASCLLFLPTFETLPKDTFQSPAIVSSDSQECTLLSESDPLHPSRFDQSIRPARQVQPFPEVSLTRLP